MRNWPPRPIAKVFLIDSILNNQKKQTWCHPGANPPNTSFFPLHFICSTATPPKCCCRATDQSPSGTAVSISQFAVFTASGADHICRAEGTHSTLRKRCPNLGFLCAFCDSTEEAVYSGAVFSTSHTQSLKRTDTGILQKCFLGGLFPSSFLDEGLAIASFCYSDLPEKQPSLTQ